MNERRILGKDFIEKYCKAAGITRPVRRLIITAYHDGLCEVIIEYIATEVDLQTISSMGADGL